MSSRTALVLLLPLALVACQGPSEPHGEHGEHGEHADHREQSVHDQNGHEKDGDHGHEGHGSDGDRHSGEASGEHSGEHAGAGHDAAANTSALDPLDDQSFRRSISRAGKYTVLWKPTVGEVPKNKHFELELRIYAKKDGQLTPLEGCKLGLSGWMPDHGHGMIVRPQATEVGDGKYTARGMLFHMGGHWQFFVDVVDGGHSERAEFDVLL